MSDAAALQRSFQKFDLNGDGHIDLSELKQALIDASQPVPSDADLKKMVAEVDTDHSGTVEFDEFVAVVEHLSQNKGSTSGFANIVHRQLNVVKGAANAQHSYSDAERINFSEYINYSLANAEKVQEYLPLDPESDDLFKKVHDGVLLAYMINHAVPNTIDTRLINHKPKNVYQKHENINLALTSAVAIGCRVVNIHSESILEGAPHLVLGLVWQIIKAGLFTGIALKENPNLIVLLQDGESLQQLLSLPPEQLLLRWFNYHLARAGHSRRVTNFSTDIADSENYLVLLEQVSNGRCHRAAALGEADLVQRAELMLQEAAKIDCRKLVRPIDVKQGNSKLNLAFTANIFNTCPALEPPKNVESINWADLYGDESDSREARAFRIWLNNLPVLPEVNNLFEDVRDGIVLLRMFDKIEPGIVAWKRVSLQPTIRFKKVENCNYAVLLGKQLKFSLVNIQGMDIVDGNRKLTLALIWQAMRYHMLKFLADLSLGSEDDILKWAIAKIASSGKSTTLSSFNDQAVKSGLFIIDLLAACEPRAVDEQFVTRKATWREMSDKEREDNAKYAIGCARKLGVTVFLLWEDIAEANKKMVLTFVATIMKHFSKV